MSELIRTLSIIGAALLLALAAFLVGRDAPTVTASSEVGKPLVKINDSLDVKGLKIAKFDKSTGDVEQFEVAQIDGLWRIPSHQNYPADAEQHLVEAATSVMDMEILDAVSDDKGAHEEFGVLDPTEIEDAEGATGVGDRVALLDAAREPLAEFIIGRQVPDQPGQRYARRMGLDQVYIVKLDPSRLSTKFADWIEEDLLQLNPFDVAQVTFDNYTFREAVDRTGNLVPITIPESDITLGYDSQESDWTLESLQVPVEPGRPESEMKAESLGDNEQLNRKNLDDMLEALDDLAIRDVERKPPGFKGKTLEEYLGANRDAATSLFNHGFLLNWDPSTQAINISSKEGEVRVGTADGVEYVLRFGRVAGGEQREAEEDAEAADSVQPTASKSDVLRYLWVSTEVNTDLIPKPELLPVPEERPEGQRPPVVEPEASDDNATEEPADEGTTQAVEPADEDADTDADAESSDADEPTTVTEEESEESPTEEPTGPEGVEGEPGTEGESGTEDESTEAAEPGEATPDAAESSEDAPSETEPAEQENDPADESTENSTSPSEESDEPETSDEVPLLEDLGPPRAEVLAENQRRQQAYQTKVESAQQKVDELNEKFADWYFVISNDVFEKIHLGRDQIIEPKPTEEAEDGNESAPALPGSPAEFNQLKNLPE